MKRIKIYIILLITTILLLSCSDKNKETQSKNPSRSLSKINITIPEGGSIYNELQKTGLNEKQILDLITGFTDDVDIQTVQPGSQFELLINKQDGSPQEFIYKEDDVTLHKLSLKDGKFEYELIEKDTEKKYRIVEGIVYNSLDQALIEKSIDSNLRHQINGALSSKINFKINAKKGDYFKIMLEENFYKNTLLKGSKLLYVYYKGESAGFCEGFYYQESDKKSAFNGMYLSNGIAMLSASLRLPLDRIHITSNFGLRIHPISRKWKMHNGIDYRATAGTPVFAIASGTVIRSNWYGGYGKTVEIKHSDGHISQYAHLSRINVNQGNAVRSGQIVGAVGSTGYSTGAHLHFGIRNKFSWLNPKNFKMVSATKLNSARMNRFNKQMLQIKKMILKHENPQTDPLEMTILEKYKRQTH